VRVSGALVNRIVDSYDAVIDLQLRACVGTGLTDPLRMISAEE
jgi:hypothetical protein